MRKNEEKGENKNDCTEKKTIHIIQWADPSNYCSGQHT